MTTPGLPAVLVFAGADPSGGAGIAADIVAIAAQGAHALPVITALTVQDNNRVYQVQPVEPELVRRQAQALIDTVAIRAVKIGIPGSADNAAAIAWLITQLRARQPALPVVLDPVLASGHGDLLCRDDAVLALAPLLAVTTVIVPNGPEAASLAGTLETAAQAAYLQAQGCRDVLMTGGHDEGETVLNRWFGQHGNQQDWRWPRLPGQFHGSGCTLAASIAARLAQGDAMPDALDAAQRHCHAALSCAYAIAPGQLMPQRLAILL